MDEPNNLSDENETLNKENAEVNTGAFDTKTEIKKFKTNLLQSITAGDSIISESSSDPLPLEVPRLRERSTSKVRESAVPLHLIYKLDDDIRFELKEAFLLFDLDGDGLITHKDLKGTLISLGENVDDHTITSMLAEAQNPLDLDAFVNLLGYKTLDFDSEDVLVAALAKWDSNNTGLISEHKIRHDITTFGDRFSTVEADYALNGAPTVKKGNQTMIDYIQFCNMLCGKMPKKNQNA